MKFPQSHIDDHAENHPDAVIEAAKHLLDEWLTMPESSGKSPRVCAAAAIYRGYHDAGYERTDPATPTQVEVATEFEVTDAAIGDRLHQFPGHWHPNNTDNDTDTDTETDTPQTND